MKDLNIIDFTDFFFNGKYLSDFGGMVGDVSGGKLTYSLLPTREYITDKPFNYEGEIIFDTRLNPRTWEVPVYFKDLEDVNIRKISKWLNSDQSSSFYFKGDTVRINARLDSDAYNLDTYSGFEGLTSLKFIAYDPYFYDIKRTIETIPRYSGLPLFNRGNVDCPCIIKASGSGIITINLAGDNISSSCEIKAITNGVLVDTENMIVTSLSGENLFNSFSGDFIQIPSGRFNITVSGGITAQLEYHSRYI